MTQWTNEDPGAGDTESILSAIKKFRAYRELADHVLAGLPKVIADTRAGYQGGGGAAEAAKLEALHTKIQSYRDHNEAGASALLPYYTEVSEIKEQMVKVNAMLTDAQDTLQGLSNDLIGQVWENVDEGLKRARDEKEERANSQLAQANLLKEDLIQRRNTADQKSLAALAAARPSNWGAVKEALLSVGADPAAATPLQKAHALQSAAYNVMNGKPPSKEDVQKFQILSDTFAGDHNALSLFAAGIGAKGFTDLLNSLSSGTSLNGMNGKDTLNAARTVRNDFVTGTKNWDKEHAQAFAEDLVHAGNAAAFLLEGPPNAGAQIVLGAAVAYDRAYRVDPVPPFDDNSSLGRLITFEHDPKQDFYPYFGGVYDARAIVFQALGQHPEQAREFFGAGGLNEKLALHGEGKDRLDYWIKQYWAEDKYAGITAALEAAGANGLTGADPATRQIAAAITSQTVKDLAGTADFTRSNISDAAAQHIATMVGAHMGGVETALNNTNPSSDSQSNLHQLHIAFGDEGSGSGALDADFKMLDLAKVIAATSGSDTGQMAWRVGLNLYEDRLTTYGAQSAATAGLSGLEMSINSATKLEGFFAGAVTGQDSADAAAESAEAQHWYALAGSTIDLLPVPGSGITTHVTQFMVDQIKDAVVQGLSQPLDSTAATISVSGADTSNGANQHMIVRMMLRLHEMNALDPHGTPLVTLPDAHPWVSKGTVVNTVSDFNHLPPAEKNDLASNWYTEFSRRLGPITDHMHSDHQTYFNDGYNDAQWKK